MTRLFWEVARRSFRQSSSYRLAAASGVFTNTVFGFLRASILILIATENGGSVRDFDVEQLATFAMLTQGFIMVVGAFGNSEIADRIRSGDIVIDFYRPVDMQMWWLATWFGNSAFQLLFRGVPPVLLGALAFDLRWPDPWWHWLPFALSVVLAVLLGFSIRFLSNLSTFWLLDNRGIDQMLTMVIVFFAGLFVPLDLFPPWLESIARFLPFAGLIQLPVEIYLGFHDGLAIARVLGEQAVWVVVLLVSGRFVMARATRKVVIQGG